jgi:hypothetical protein
MYVFGFDSTGFMFAIGKVQVGRRFPAAVVELVETAAGISVSELGVAGFAPSCPNGVLGQACAGCRACRDSRLRSQPGQGTDDKARDEQD